MKMPVSNKICRTCLSTEKELLSIATEIEDNCRIIDYFTECVKILIDVGDGLPQTICLSCLDNILEVRKFYLQCVNAENYFKHARQNMKLETKIVEEFASAEFIDLHGDGVNDAVMCAIIESSFKEFDKTNVNFRCIKCTETFKYEKNYKLHMAVEHGMADNDIKGNEGSLNIICRSDKTNTDEKLKNKMRQAQEQTKFDCFACGYSFRFRSNFTNHMRRHKITKETGCKCPHYECDKEFYNVNSLHRHVLEAHTAENSSLLCPTCGVTFETKKKYQTHMNEHNTQAKPTKKHQCKFCEKSFMSRDHLRCHERRHTNERPYSCSVCNKTFKQSSVLKTHMTLHTGKPISCSVCDKKFSRKGFLVIHMRTHTQERPYLCSYCPQSYTQKCHLKYHMAGHTNDRPYVCDVCGKTFVKKEILRGHRYRHATIKPYKCPFCSLETASSFWFRKHLKRAHNVDEDIKKYKRDIRQFLPPSPPHAFLGIVNQAEGVHKERSPSDNVCVY